MYIVMKFHELEDWLLVIAMILAGISEALGAEARYTLYALILGGAAKGIISLIQSNNKKNSEG